MCTGESILERFLVFSYKDTSSGAEPTFMNSFNINYFFVGTVVVRASEYEFWRNTVKHIGCITLSPSTELNLQ